MDWKDFTWGAVFMGTVWIAWYVWGRIRIELSKGKPRRPRHPKYKTGGHF